MSMKHRKLGRTSDQRRAMLRAMVTYLLENGQIKTTVTRAKEVAPVAEKMITLSVATLLSLLISEKATAQIGEPDIHDPSTIMECEGKYYTFGTDVYKRQL